MAEPGAVSTPPGPSLTPAPEPGSPATQPPATPSPSVPPPPVFPPGPPSPDLRPSFCGAKPVLCFGIEQGQNPESPIAITMACEQGSQVPNNLPYVFAYFNDTLGSGINADAVFTCFAGETPPTFSVAEEFVVCTVSTSFLAAGAYSFPIWLVTSDPSAASLLAFIEMEIVVYTAPET